MTERVYWRLSDMKAASTDIQTLLADNDIGLFAKDRAARAANERFLEILSEASRHIPEEWKGEFPHVPWRQAADLGNFIRHAYHKIDLEILWAIYENDLGAIENVVDKLMDRSKPAGQ